MIHATISLFSERRETVKRIYYNSSLIWSSRTKENEALVIEIRSGLPVEVGCGSWLEGVTGGLSDNENALILIGAIITCVYTSVKVYQTAQLVFTLFTLVKVYFNEAHLKEKNNKEVTANLNGKVNIELVNCWKFCIYNDLLLASLVSFWWNCAYILLYNYGFVHFFLQLLVDISPSLRFSTSFLVLFQVCFSSDILLTCLFLLFLYTCFKYSR